MNFVYLIISAAFLSNNLSNGSKILAVFYTSSPSHHILGNSYLLALAEAGHDVTMVSPFKNKITPKNGTYRDVVLSGFYDDYTKFLDKEITQNNSILTSALQFTEYFITEVDKTLNHPNFRKILESDETFDAVILPTFLSEPLFGLGYKYGAPVILFCTFGTNQLSNSYMGIPYPIAYIPNTMLGFTSKMTFFQRTINTLLYVIFEMTALYVIPKQETIYKKHFPDGPSLNMLKYNSSFIFFNAHESINPSVPAVPNSANIAGFHIRPPKQLPNDIKTFLDGSKNGAIFFSLGSNIKSNSLSKLQKDAFLNCFSKLNLSVLMKWEEELPNYYKNIKAGKWLPQSDILVHPNLKLFVTHGGLLSTTETIDRGIPILAIPVRADQHLNAMQAVSAGYALSIPFGDVTEDKLMKLIEELLTNPKYKEKARSLSKLYHDRPMKPKDTLIYWTEYVIKYKGAKHLKVAGVELNWFQYMLVDVIIFLATVIILILYLISKIIKLLALLCFKRKDVAMKQNFKKPKTL